MNVHLEKARDEDAGDITDLINLAYRGEEGWTKETALIDGDRVQYNTISELLLDSNIHFLVTYNLGDLLACICIEQSVTAANFGFFSVNPKYQTLGIGKSVLAQAESYALNGLKLKKTAMQVVQQRTELVSFYERRGYRLTGLVKPYPKNLSSGTPMKDELNVVYLEKKLVSS